MNSRELFIKLILPHFCQCGNKDCLLLTDMFISDRHCPKWHSTIECQVHEDGVTIRFPAPTTQLFHKCYTNIEFQNPDVETIICQEIIKKFQQ